MITQTSAVYENGVLRPAQPLPLPDGETVQITVTTLPVAEPTEDEVIRMIRAARTPEEVFAIMQLHPDQDDYDLTAALNENRRRAGDGRMLTSEPTGGAGP